MYFYSEIEMMTNTHTTTIICIIMQIVLFVGTKLEIVVAKMAMQLANNNTVIKGTPLVQPDSSLFWFKRPQLVLTLLHFILFMVMKTCFEVS